MKFRILLGALFFSLLNLAAAFSLQSSLNHYFPQVTHGGPIFGHKIEPCS